MSACRAQPLNIPRLLLCARAEGRAGNLDAANEFRYIADAQIGGAYSVAAELRVATQPLVGRTLEGNPAIFWGTFTYRRPTPWDMLVPSSSTSPLSRAVLIGRGYHCAPRTTRH